MMDSYRYLKKGIKLGLGTGKCDEWYRMYKCLCI